MPPTARTAHTATRILDAAEALAQTRGFNGFSYADVAARVGITTASLHYHFPSKADLGRALIDRYAGRFETALAQIDEQGDGARGQLAAYTGLYEEVLRDGRLCLCGMLAAEYDTLPAPMQDAVRRFFDRNEEWLAAVLESGRSAGELQFAGDAQDAASLIVSGLEGAMLIARSSSSLRRFRSAAAQLLALLRAEAAGA
jgi:TetR/AcrR family transcriptional repressor of nem operon